MSWGASIVDRGGLFPGLQWLETRCPPRVSERPGSINELSRLNWALGLSYCFIFSALLSLSLPLPLEFLAPPTFTYCSAKTPSDFFEGGSCVISRRTMIVAGFGGF
jgi:hypothetical protein